MYNVLVVDDDMDLRMTVASALSEHHFNVSQAKDGEEAVNRIRAGKFDLVLMDVNMPRMSGLEALKEIKSHDPSIIVIMLTAFSNVRDAVEATREGAYNYLEKPIQADNLVYLVEKALKANRLVRDLALSSPTVKLPEGNEFVGQSQEMKKVFSVIEKLSGVDTAVLIRGESGTGKELVAKALHFNSPRKENRFVTVNCSAIPENLIESEFFGHEKGAFTGADSRKIGKFQYADGGTLFLDEIGDISAALQVKLLRVLQEKRFTPIGSNREVEVNVRIVAATHRNLEEMIKSGDFREDLFYRLNVLPVQLPPLRERKNDIDALVTHFIEKFNQAHRKDINGLHPQVMEVLKAHQWPGNIRELENVMEHAFVIECTQMIGVDSLPEALIAKSSIKRNDSILNEEVNLSQSSSAVSSQLGINKGEVLQGASIFAHSDDDGNEDESIDLSLAQNQSVLNTAAKFTLEFSKLDFEANKEEFEKVFLINALKTFNGKINQTAIQANIPKKTLLRKLEKYGIVAKDFK